ncbi:MAG: RNA polymerase sigma factor [Candidatus Pacebacteria bacterium]|nr:RNA polymerase sigma factor [Candidatus Paceibacterota bacterium]
MIIKEECDGKTDEELAYLTLKDEDYYLCLMQRYEEKLLRYIHRISGLFEKDAQDILQETFIKVYKNLNDFDKKLKFSSWIYRIAHNEVISNWRKRKARPKMIFIEDNDFLESLSSEFTTDIHLEKKYKKETVKKVLKNLDQKYKEILELKYLEQKDYKEISDILKIPMGSVATLLNRARERFKKEVKEKNITF